MIDTAPESEPEAAAPPDEVSNQGEGEVPLADKASGCLITVGTLAPARGTSSQSVRTDSGVRSLPCGADTPWNSSAVQSHGTCQAFRLCTAWLAS